MKLIVFVAALALVAAAAAAPADVPLIPVETLRSGFERQPEGGFSFFYETADQSKREETGEIKTVNDEDNKPQTVVAMRGSFSYVDPAGNPHSTNYYADETGYHAESEDVPKSK